MTVLRPLKVCLLIAPVLLGGCTLLPVSFQVASMALDGISLIATQKSLTDHGISAITQKDCALWRSVTSKTICQEESDLIDTVVVEAPSQPVISDLYLSVL